MSEDTRRGSPSSDVLPTSPNLDPQPIHPSSHPLSDEPSVEGFMAGTRSDAIIGIRQPKRRPPSILSSSATQNEWTNVAKLRTHPSPAMRLSTSSSGSKAPNDRNLIFDEWITSTAHPALAAHSLIPLELVDDEKAIQDMLAEAMNDEQFASAPKPIQEEVTVDRPLTPMSATDIPAVKVAITTRPRSSSGLSLRKWAGMVVGRGETGKIAVSSTNSGSSRPNLTQNRSFSAPETTSPGNEPAYPTSTKSAFPIEQFDLVDIPDPEVTAIAAKMSRSSSSDGLPSISISSPKTPIKHSQPLDGVPLHRIHSAPAEEIPSLEQMRAEVAKSITTLRSPTRLRATTLSNETRSRNCPDHAVQKPLVLSQSSSSASLTSLDRRSPAPVVELDTIVPAGIQPPSVSPRWDDHYKAEESGFTDRYGFIVAAHRRENREDIIDLRETLRERTRSDEERWTTVANETEERIEELRKLGAKEKRHTASSFIEGLSTPTRGDITPASVAMIDMKVHSPLPESKPMPPLAHEVLPVETEHTSTPTSDPIVPILDAAPLTPSLSVSATPVPSLANASDLSTIKLLLSKLNDLHDSLDRANKQRWDKWLSQSDPTDSLLTPPPGTKDRKQRLKDFKSLVMGGIPVKYRSKIWAECSGAAELFRPGYFEELCALGTNGLDTVCVQQIQMDIHRTMPNNVFFGGNGPGIAKLERVLTTFSRHNPIIGYCQGMNVITATLLLVHSTDEEAFWGLAAIIERILPEGYFTPDLIASRADQRVLKRLVRELCPRAHAHLQRLGVDLEAITFNWFLSVFTDCLPAEALFRVWDVFFVEGSAYMFRVALAVIKINEKLILGCKTPASVYSFLKDMTSRMFPIDKLISMSCEGLERSVRNELIEKMRKVEIEGLKQEMDGLYQ